MVKYTDSIFIVYVYSLLSSRTGIIPFVKLVKNYQVQKMGGGGGTKHRLRIQFEINVQGT